MVEHNYTGIVVPPRDSVQASKAIERLLFNQRRKNKNGQIFQNKDLGKNMISKGI
ncbi:MAG: hypothetical protein MZV64_16145 [Ignavibacteriales bacterium]|nr:hypothetical protein [Ignavibacteriales bacterium]